MPLQGHHTSLEGGCISSANPVKNYKRSWALVNDASGPSRADFASAHMNLPFFVNYIWFIILRVNYNYVGKLQLVIIDCDQVWSIVWIAIDCLNCDRLPELWLIIWVVIDCTSCDLLYELQHCPTILWIGSNCTQFRSLHIMTCNCNYLSSFSGLQAIGTLLQSVFLCNWSLILSINNIVL